MPVDAVDDEFDCDGFVMLYSWAPCQADFVPIVLCVGM